MQKNKTEFNYTVKRLITLSLAVSVGLLNSFPQVSAQSSEESPSHSESYSSDEQDHSNNENSSSGEDDSSSNSESSSSEQDLEAQQTTIGANGDLYHRTEWTEQETQQLLAIAYMDNRPQFEPEPASNQAPQQNQASTRTCLQAAIRFLAMAFRPCFRGILGSSKKDL